MIFELAALGSWLFWEYRCAKRAGFGWREFKGVTKFLLVAPKPIPPCRACGEELPDNHLLREDIGHGAALCLDCYDEVALEAGLIRPDWFEKPLPPEGSEVPELAALKAALDARKEAPPRPPGPEFEVERHPPGGGDYWFKDNPVGGEPYRWPTEVWRVNTAQLVCPEPRMNCTIKNCGDPACKLPPSVPRQILDRQQHPPRREWCDMCHYYHDPDWPCLD